MGVDRQESPVVVVQPFGQYLVGSIVSDQHDVKAILASGNRNRVVRIQAPGAVAPEAEEHGGVA